MIYSFVLIREVSYQERLVHHRPALNSKISLAKSCLALFAVEMHINHWIVQINDITEKCRQIQQLILNKKIDQAKNLLPAEQNYNLSEHTFYN